jgi:protein O-GlcNAc transferase
MSQFVFLLLILSVLTFAKTDKKQAADLIYQGNEASKQGKLQNALELYTAARELNPKSGPAHYGIGEMSYLLKLNSQSISAFDLAIVASSPRLKNEQLARANCRLATLWSSGNLEKTAESYTKCIHHGERAIAEQRGTAWSLIEFAYIELARLCEKEIRLDQAKELYLKAAAMKNEDSLKVYGNLLLPSIYESQANLLWWRNIFLENLKSLHSSSLRINNPFSGVTSMMPQYFLSYHGLNDKAVNSQVHDLLFEASKHVTSVTAPHVKRYVPPTAGDKIKVVFVSAFFRHHSVAKMLAGLLYHLDKSKFEIVLFFMGSQTDKHTQMLTEFGKATLIHLDPGQTETNTLQTIQTKLHQQEADIIVYTDLGMDPFSYYLAMGRHAPVQLAMHGHADTTGIANIDYYVTYDGFDEGPGPVVSAKYSEAVLRVPGVTPLANYYFLFKDAMVIPRSARTKEGQDIFRRRYGVPLGKTIYLCMQLTHKISPSMDTVLRTILEGDPNAVVLLKEPLAHMQFNTLGKRVIARMSSVISENLMQRIIFLPNLPDEAYATAQAAATVCLDSFPFGGHTTTMDLLVTGCPIVTLPSEFMAGRCTQGLLKALGGIATQMIASDLDEYVAIALRIGTDPAYRELQAQNIRENLPSLIKNFDSSIGWEQMLEALAHKKSLDEWLQTKSSLETWFDWA